ncbi:DUF1758 domain-containing protein [Trichonephila clavata]|uniref:DUF1758 domain-containing protein n=1 Tax=Trichonephila clavata TaxID=2740835 RepID=A0A8X6HC54_TRICU|nr:DUF1758 domain-containing protein [Trichonephila clavata]
MGLEIPAEAKVIQLKNLIESSDLYRDDIDFVRELMSNIQEKRDEIELQKLKLSQFEKELELINAKKGLADISLVSETKESSSLTDNLECLIRRVKVLIIPVPVKSESRLSVWERAEVIKRNNLFRCFMLHKLSECRSVKNCFCSKPHHSLIHFPCEDSSYPPSQLKFDAPVFIPKQSEETPEAV